MMVQTTDERTSFKIPVKFFDQNKHFCYIDKINMPEELTADYIEHNVFQEIDGKVVFSYSLLPVLRNVFGMYSVKFDTTEIRSYYQKDIDNFDISDPLFLRPDQYETIKNYVYKHYRGIVQARTGLGKGEIIVYLTKTCTLPGNRLVLSNNNQVAVELEQRFEKYGYNVSDLHTMVLNPISFMNSNRCKDPEILEFLKDVTFIQIDELESVTSSLRELLELTPNYKILYGYSASPEKVKGFDLSNADNILKVNDDAVQVLSLAGFSLYYVPPEKPLTINVIRTKLQNERFPPWVYDNDSPGALVMKQKLSQANLFKSNVFFKALDSIILPRVEGILFIPYRFIEHGDAIFQHYKHTSYKIVQWDGEKIRSNIRGKSTLKQADIKQMSIDREFDILIASAVANRGVDFRNMRDIFMFIHSQYNNVIQAVGRLSRESSDAKAHIWLIHNTENNTPFYSMMANARLNRIKSAYAGADLTFREFQL